MQVVPVDPNIAFAQARWDSLTDRERAARIIAAVKAQRTNLTELALRLGLRYASVHAWTTADAHCDWARWMAISLALGLPQTWEPSESQLTAALDRFDKLRPDWRDYTDDGPPNPGSEGS